MAEFSFTGFPTKLLRHTEQHWHDEHGHEFDDHSAEDGDGHGDHEVGAAAGAGVPCAVQMVFLSRRALRMTERELTLMAAPAIMGLRRVPVRG